MGIIDTLRASGARFGRLEIVRESDDSTSRNRKVVCRCDCGAEVNAYLSNVRHGRTKSCGCLNRKMSSDRMKGDRNPQWVGGRCIDQKGYVWIRKPDHPNANSQGAIAEHRLVMEKHLGRHLEPEEEVHHKDGDPSNNYIENLHLCVSKSDHSKIHGESRRTGEVRSCPTCESQFYVPKNRVESGRGKYCSVHCYNEHRRALR